MNLAAPVLLAALFIALPAQAQTTAPADGLRDFCAQRPGKATPPCVVDAGHLQIETGLADAVFQHGDGVHADTYTLGATELRLGISRRVELEAAWPPVVVNQTRGQPHESGTGDASLAVLVALSDPDKMGVAVSAQAFVTVPTATHGLGAGGWTGGARLPMAIPLSDGLSLGLTPEIDVLRNVAGGGTHAAWIGVASLGRSFGPVTLGAELWGQVEDEPAGTIRRASADLIAALMVGKTLQLDAGANFGLNRQTPDAEVYVGISHRF
ncbi:MAG TPA: transporter [Phenylobacterium sp.]|nr:transporter [Phenylobacterium sp.]